MICPISPGPQMMSGTLLVETNRIGKAIVAEFAPSEVSLRTLSSSCRKNWSDRSHKLPVLKLLR
jgi:hypothetical protein